MCIRQRGSGLYLFRAPVPRTMSATPHIPQNGDRILIYTPHQLQLVLSGSKTLEVRNKNYRPGRYWLGCHSQIFAMARLGAAFLIGTEREWDRLREQHRRHRAQQQQRQRSLLPRSRSR